MPSATLIGDVVGSRGAGDRTAVHTALSAALRQVNNEAGPVVPLRITVGDEYQGAFASVGEALRVALRLRLALLPEYDVRHGLGWGPVQVLSAEPRVEDGPGWWAARAAIETVHRAEQRAATRWRRTAYRRAEDVEGPDPAAVEAGLVLCDELIGGLSARSVSVLRGLLEGRTQRDLAEDLRISPSAVSQRVRADALSAVVLADEMWTDVR